MASRIASSRPDTTRAPSADSMMSHDTADASSNANSSSSTPPTSAADTVSVSSQSLKFDADSTIADETQETESSGRPRRSRKSIYGSYNVKALADAAQDASKTIRKVEDAGRSPATRRRTISGETLVATLGERDTTPEVALQTTQDQSHASPIVKMQTRSPRMKRSRSPSATSSMVIASPKKAKKTKEPAKRIGTRSAGIQPIDLAHTLSSLGKRARNKFEEQLTRSKRELRRLADTAEFAKIEDKPVIHTVWSNGKFVPAGEEPPSRKKVKKTPSPVAESKNEDDAIEPVKVTLPIKGPKKWAVKGFYSGQDGEAYWKGKTPAMAKPTRGHPAEDKPNGAFPLPIYAGDRMLDRGRDFKLPFDVCNPLTERQPKPDEWRKMPKNRFVGDAAAAWKKSTLFDDFSSRCICSSDTGCDEDCQNRIMLYECDAGNCKFGAKDPACQNRPFAKLHERKVKGGKFNIGVEVIKTLDRGYGVRSNRCFVAHDIITEYTGEIITEDECDRRMNNEYKKNDCYYLMSFDQNTILDGTKKGSIARFVNHSCDPNCRMVKWVVNGKPRMALFVGERDIMTGEELTYDYNFDPFSAKNVQECRCGSTNCRGILGPRPKDQKPLKPAAIVSGIKNVIGKGKRKLQEMMGVDGDEKAIKKRKIAEPKGVKRSMSTKTLDAVAGIKRSVSKSLGVVAGIKLTHKPRVVKKTYKRSVGIEKRKVSGLSTTSSLTMVATSESKKAGSVKSVKIKAAPKKLQRKGGYVKKGGWGGVRIKGVKKA